MQIHLIAVGRRLPDWVNEAYASYARRLQSQPRLQLIEITPGQRRHKQSVARAIDEEWQRMQAAIPKGATPICLDEHGRSWNSRQLATQLQDWMEQGTDLAVLIGGPDGLHGEALARSQQHWSLSPLTLPHGLVRVVVAEQLYRAWSILNQHPYHRD